MDIRKKVIVAGAGIAGLTCAQRLIERGFDVMIVEASEKYGGRLQPGPANFAKFPIERGGQVLDFKDTPYYNFAVGVGAQFFETDYMDGMTTWDPYQQRMIDLEELKQKYPKVYSSIEFFVENYEKFDADISVKETLEKEGFDMAFDHFYEGVLGAESGAKNSNHSSKLLGQFDSQYPTFVLNYSLTNMNHADVLSQAFSLAMKVIKYNWVVKKVRIQNDHVEVVNEQNDQIICDYFVSAIPVNQLHKIDWQPAFSQQRINELNKIKMDKGGKLIIKLDQVMKTDIGIIHLNYPYSMNLWNNSLNGDGVLIAILCQDAYDYSKQITIEKFAEELIKLVNEQLHLDLKIVQFDYTDWGETKFIEGLYSYPNPGASLNYHQIIGEPIQDKIYFCGEYVHPVYTQAMIGACETGLQVANTLK